MPHCREIDINKNKMDTKDLVKEMKARNLILRLAATVKRRAAIGKEVAESRDLQRQSGSPLAPAVGRRSADAWRDTGIPVVQDKSKSQRDGDRRRYAGGEVCVAHHQVLWHFAGLCAVHR